MPSLRQEITRTFMRLSGRGRSRYSAVSPRRAGVVIRAGQQFGSYRVLRQLGSGGMGDVYLALDTRLGRHAALKFLPSDLTADESILYRFRQEARAASALNHPNILTIYDIGETEGEHFIASEFVDGVTLRSAMHKDGIDIQAAVEIGLQVASALVAAHAAGIIHRDLKPSNIMIRPDGYVKVIDFGLAKLTSASNRRHNSTDLTWTKPGAILGTVEYMSPEQARGEEVDQRTDLWSLGVILYEMAARKLPFEGDTESHIIVNILDKPAPSIQEDAAFPGLARIIDRLLNKDRAKRYQTAQEVLIDLQQVSRSPGSKPSTGRLMFPPPHPRHRRSLLAIAAAIIMIAILGLAWWRYGDEFFGPKWFEYDSIRRVTFDANVALASISPNGQYLAYVSSDQNDQTLCIRQLQTGSETRLQAVNEPYTGLTFSPDGNYLYYVLKNPQTELGRLYRIKIGSHLPSLLLEDVDGPLAFSPDGKQFAFVRRAEEKGISRSSIFLCHAGEWTNPHEIVSKTNTQIGAQLAWSPRGDRIAAIFFAEQLEKPTEPRIYLFSLDGRSQGEVPASAFRHLSFPVWLDNGSLLIFSGLPQGAQLSRLEQLFVPSGTFHEQAADVVSFDSISATADSKTLAAVQLDRRSSIWVSDAHELGLGRKLTPDAENFDSLVWLDDDSLAVPSARSGNVNLSRLDKEGTLQPLAANARCVQYQPAVIPGAHSIVYSSNCAAGGADFNIWRLDLNTRHRTQLTVGSNFDSQPDVSADGKWVVYTSWPSNSPSIWKVSTAGGLPQRITSLQAWQPFISPDGKKIVCQIREPRGSWHVAILDFADGRILQEVPQIPITTAAPTPVRWSPDGAALDYVSAAHNGVSSIWRQWLKRAWRYRLIQLPEDNILYFAWNRSGTKLAYIRGRTQSDVVLFHRASRD